MSTGLDDTDAAILRILARDGRATHQEVADRVDLRRPSVHARVKRLEDEGFIQGYEARLDAERVGAGLVAFAMLKLNVTGGDCFTCSESVAERLRKIPEVLEYHTVAGEEDALIKVRCRDVRDLERVMMRSVSGTEGVAAVKTIVVMRTHFERPIQPPAPRRSSADPPSPSVKAKSGR